MTARLVVGMDLHRRCGVLVPMTEDGQRLGTARITNSPAELRKAIAWAWHSPRRSCWKRRRGGIGRRTRRRRQSDTGDNCGSSQCQGRERDPGWQGSVVRREYRELGLTARRQASLDEKGGAK